MLHDSILKMERHQEQLPIPNDHPGVLQVCMHLQAAEKAKARKQAIHRKRLIESHITSKLWDKVISLCSSQKGKSPALMKIKERKKKAMISKL